MPPDPAPAPPPRRRAFGRVVRVVFWSLQAMIGLVAVSLLLVLVLDAAGVHQGWTDILAVPVMMAPVLAPTWIGGSMAFGLLMLLTRGGGRHSGNA